MKDSLYCHLNCPLCDEVKTTGRALYFHLRYEYKIGHDEAYEFVGSAMQESSRQWGKEQVKNSLDDRFYYKHKWKGFYERGTDQQKLDYFSKDKVQF